MSVRASSVTPDLSRYNDKPTLKGIEGAQAFLESEGLDVGFNALRDAVFYKKVLPRFKFGRSLQFSERDVMRWVFSRRQP